MNLDYIQDNFQAFIDAPNGVKRFNNLILELALSGNLNNASNKQRHDVSALPENWEIRSFAEIAKFTIGKTPPTKNSSLWGKDDSIMWVSIADMSDGETILQSKKRVSQAAQKDIFRREPWPAGTLLMSFKLSIGKVGRLGSPAFFNEAIFAFDSGNHITNEYLFRVLPVVSRMADHKGAIKGNTLNSESIRKMLIPIPPIEEQRLLIDLIDEFSYKVQQLDEELKVATALRNNFRNSSIDAMSTSQTGEELLDHWGRIANNWEVFAGNLESVGKLRSLILTLATSGLLEKQEQSELPPNFESVANAKEIPRNWIWCELGAIALYGGSGSVPPKRIPSDAWILDLEDIEKKTSKLLARAFAVDRMTSSNKTPFKSGDVLYGKLRPYLDKVLVADMPGFCTTEIVPIRPKDELDPDWLRICLKRPEFIKKVTDLSYGTKMPRLGTNDAKKSVHPIPPLEEQRRIVKRVDLLMKICDQLEQELLSANDLAEKFSRSVVSVSA